MCYFGTESSQSQSNKIMIVAPPLQVLENRLVAFTGLHAPTCVRKHSQETVFQQDFLNLSNIYRYHDFSMATRITSLYR